MGSPLWRQIRSSSGHSFGSLESFRTKDNRTLELVSSPKEISGKSKIKIAVKVIDIFGNDTMKVLEVNI